MISTSTITFILVVIGLFLGLFILRKAVSIFLKMLALIIVLFLICAGIVGYDFWKTGNAYTSGEILVLSGYNETLKSAQEYTKDTKFNSLNVDDYQMMYLEYYKNNFTQLVVPENFTALVIFYTPNVVPSRKISPAIFFEKNVFITPKPKTLSYIKK